MVIHSSFTKHTPTLYITQSTAHTRSTIGSALIITYRKNYRSTVDTILTFPTTHSTRSDRAKCDTSTGTVGVIVGRSCFIQAVCWLKVSNLLSRELCELKVNELLFGKFFAAQASPGTGRRWSFGNTTRCRRVLYFLLYL